MKKFIPILTLIGCSALFVGCDAMMNTNTNEANTQGQEIVNTNNLNSSIASKQVGNYNLSIIERENDVSMLNETIDDAQTDEIINEESNIINNQPQDEINEDIDNNEPIKNDNLNSISTLYSLSADIEQGCEDFCELKEDILNAIKESEELSTKIQNGELDLTREQRLYLNEQSVQLKNLARELSNATNTLSFNLSDLNAIMQKNNQDFDELSLKYLIVLDNLVNGNEMLNNGLKSLNLLNDLIKFNSPNLVNNNSKIYYKYKNNNDPEVFKEYTIDEKGELKEEIINNTNSEIVNSDNNDKSTNIDTYKNNNLQTNIDTYGNNRRNIDTFFNTALIDNDFMYGNGQMTNGFYGNYGGMYGNPNMNQYIGYEQNNENNDNKSSNNKENTNNNTSNKQKKKKFKLKSNIDTYRDESTPDIKSKIKNFKSSISNFFNRANINPKNDIITPIFKFKD